MLPTPPPGQGQVPDTGNPLIDWAFEYFMLWVLVALTLLGAWAKLKPYLASIKKDAAKAREQTENSHSDAPYPNLRDNIDANQAESRAAFQALMQASDQMREVLAQQAKDIGGIRAELRADREAQRETARALAEHIRDTHKTP